MQHPGWAWTLCHAASLNPLCCLAAAGRKYLSVKERAMVCWFLCSGLIHLIIEGELQLHTSSAFRLSWDNQVPAGPVHHAATRAHLTAGTVVVNSNFYKDTSGNILNEICEPCQALGLHGRPCCVLQPGQPRCVRSSRHAPCSCAMDILHVTCTVLSTTICCCSMA